MKQWQFSNSTINLETETATEDEIYGSLFRGAFFKFKSIWYAKCEKNLIISWASLSFNVPPELDQLAVRAAVFRLELIALLKKS